MPGITDRYKGEPLLKTQELAHGTLECVDIHRSRRFYEEVLGLQVLQTSPRSLMIRKGSNHTYAVVETGKVNAQMILLNHNGFNVGSVEEVDAAYETLLKVKDEYGLKQVQKPRHSHGDSSFYFCDLDGNWWEIVSVRPGGYSADYADEDRDLTGHHEFDDLKGNFNMIHTHDPDFRAQFRKVLDEKKDGANKGDQT
ncbi:VOC family protein [Streptomyces phaeochromogenes]|uniref:VOC family protein n=1 Tax=Streptomyces phaeochromogenes TaxID=1923 RepID=UPI002DDB20CC|nr:VOC family protein [Streptomyces phaeochromogenes]WRZ34499.1 VOC family protein [Streptomyces phaeochromogenes]